ncbi:MAG: hypothetical protein ABSC94_04090 [Polyangiaceae bacterium]|jgi:F-type H+-transporting ATPase subunit b
MSGWTVAFQVINFLILAVVLHRVLFKPVSAVIARRKSEIDAAARDAETAKRAAEEIRARYEGELEKWTAEREALLYQVRSQNEEERQRALQQASEEAATLVRAARAEIARERVDAVERLADLAVSLGTELAGRLLEQVAGSGIAEVLLARACDHLESLPVERLGSLRDELKSNAASLEVATSPPLAADARTRWAERIARDIDAGTVVRFVTDAALIAGAELRFPHTKLSFCWRDGLQAAREELVRRADAR